MRMTSHGLFRLRTSSGAIVCTSHDGTGRCVGRTIGQGDVVSEIAAFVPPGASPYGFLAASDSPGPIRLLGDPSFAALLSIVIEPTHEAGSVALRCPNAPIYVSATPPEVSTDADLNCNRFAVSDWEMFSLEPRDPASVHPRTAALFRHIELLFTTPVTLTSVLAWLDRLDRAVAEASAVAVLRLLTREDLASLSARLLDDGELLAKVQMLLPEDDWFKTMLPALRQWIRTREREVSVAVDPDDGHRQARADRLRVAPFGEIVHALAREHVDPTGEVCVIATVRNEGIYILEWIAHHKAIGVEHFIIYSNDNDDGSDRLLEELARTGLITWVRNDAPAGADFQRRAYAHCLTYLRRPLDYRWSLIVDLDEFLILNPERYGSLPDFLRLQRSRGAEAVAMNWTVYTPNRQLLWREAPLIERFTWREAGENHMVKTAFVPRFHAASHPHNPVPNFGRIPLYLNASGGLHHGPGSSNEPHQGEPGFSDAWVGHYYFKSVEEFIWKAARGHDMREDLNVDVGRLFDYLRSFDGADQVEDLRALPHLDGLMAELASLRAMPGLREAEQVARENFRLRVNAMRRRALDDVLRHPGFSKADKQRMARLLLGRLFGGNRPRREDQT